MVHLQLYIVLAHINKGNGRGKAGKLTLPYSGRMPATDSMS